MKKKKIAFFISHPIQYISPLFRKLAKNEFIDLRVYYFSDETINKSFKDKEFGKEIKWDTDLLGGYKYKFIKNNSISPSIYNMPFGLVNINSYKEINNNNYDLVIVHGWNYVSHWIVFISSIILKVPILLRAETPHKQELLKSKIKVLIKRMLLKPLFNKISGFLSIGTQNKNFFKSYKVQEKKIYFAPYAIDNDSFRNNYLNNKVNKIDFRKKYNLNKYNKIVLFVGKLIDKKNPIDLLKAFHELNDENNCLVFVGDGNNKEKMKDYIQRNNISNVILVGFKNQSELVEFYVLSDIFVLPSGLGETWGLVVNEAMNYSLPIIVSDTVGCSDDLIVDNGFTFKEKDIDDLSIKLNKLLKANNLDEMGENSYNIIKEYSYENIEKAILEALNNVVVGK